MGLKAPPIYRYKRNVYKGKMVLQATEGPYTKGKG